MSATYPIHPAANLFPMLPDDEFERLKEDIATNDLQEAIVLYKGQIVDGRNRYKACKELGRHISVEELEDDHDPVAFVISANLYRRQLKQSQKAMCAARMAGLPHGVHGKEVPIGTSSAESAAELFGVGRRAVFRALDVLRKGCTELIRLCDLGKVSVSLASEFVEAFPSKQKQAPIAKRGRKVIKEALGKDQATATTKATDPKESVILQLEKACTGQDVESVVADVERWLESHDDRPVLERFNSLWAVAGETDRDAIRAMVIE